MAINKIWSDAKGLNLKPEFNEKARKGLAAAADWATRNQIRHAWPRWNANAGRFPYHVYLITDDHFYSTSWNTARAVQGILSAHTALGCGGYLDTAERGLAYVKSVQTFAPEHAKVHGLFVEETPQTEHIGLRDGVECTQALLAHYRTTKNPVSLQRAQAFLDRFCILVENDEWPLPYIYLNPPPTEKFKPTSVPDNWVQLAVAIPLVQAAVLTGQKKYQKMAEHCADLILQHTLCDDGAFRAKGASHLGHHVSDTETALVNDDGIGVALVCAGVHSGKKKYLEAAMANGDWWVKRGDDLPQNHASLLAATLFMAELARATGEARYLEWLNAMAERFFEAQILRDERPLVSGAFVGEDMAGVYRRGAETRDFVSLRCTSYGMIALGKLAARKASEWGPAYSAFGF